MHRHTRAQTVTIWAEGWVNWPHCNPSRHIQRRHCQVHTLNLHNLRHQSHLSKGEKKKEEVELRPFHFNSKYEAKYRKQGLPHWGQDESVWSPLGSHWQGDPFLGDEECRVYNTCLKYKRKPPVQSPTKSVVCLGLARTSWGPSGAEFQLSSMGQIG